MDRLDTFAAFAMTGILSDKNITLDDGEPIAANAYRLAWWMENEALRQPRRAPDKPLEERIEDILRCEEGILDPHDAPALAHVLAVVLEAGDKTVAKPHGSTPLE